MKRRFGDYGNYQTGSGSKRLFSPAHQRDQRSLEEAKKVMSEVMRKLELTDSKKNEEEFFQYIKSMIDNLNASTERKTTVGVFGKSGVGKSSLINAILGEQDLLPTGTINACTSVIIQIEANTTDEYTAEIEFIPKQEWEEEVKSYLHDKLSEGTESRHVGDTESSAEKIQAVYGDVGPKTTLEELMEDKKFAAIPEFLKSDKKTVSHNSASKLSEDITCFTVSRPDKYSPEQYFWPLVKTVIIKVPNDLLENLVFIDLPGTGDLNKSRDEMWKKCLSRCSTVWIVNEINRAASDKEPWKILTNCIKDIAHGGECNSITFICTKTDDINPNLYMKCYKLKETDLKIQGTKDTEEYKTRLKHACILNRNKRAKEQVKQMFSQQNELQINFACDENFLKVFTVSAQVFQLMECSILNGEDTEIPELRRLLEKLNNSVNNNFAKNYIQGAYGILSLIQGANSKTEHTLAVKLEVLRTLRKILSEKIASLQDALAKHHLSLDACLSEGVKKSETSSLNKADEVVIKSTIKDGRGYHRTLKALCKNNGYWRRTTSETSETIDLNETLCEDMYKHVNELFQELFPRDASGKNVKSDKSIRGMLQRFNIISRDMTEKYKESPVSLNLTFIKTQQNKQILRYEEEVLQRKKSVYKSIYESISSRMKQVYPDAAAITGKHCLVDMQKMLKDYIESSTPDMFCEAKTTMLNLFKDLTKHIERTLKDRLDGIVIQALTFNLPLPDVCTELESMTKLNMWPDKCDPVWLHDPVQTETFQTELGATGSQSKSKANPSTLTSSTKPVSTDDLQRVHMEKKIQMCDLQMSYLHLKTEKVKLQIQALKFQPQEQTREKLIGPSCSPKIEPTQMKLLECDEGQPKKPLLQEKMEFSDSDTDYFLTDLSTGVDPLHHIGSLRTCESCSNIPDTTDWALKKPTLSSVDGITLYSHNSRAGKYECVITGLRWVCSEDVTLNFLFRFMLMPELKFIPISPLTDLTVVSGRLEEVHLPHFACLGGLNSTLYRKVCVLHRDDTRMSFEMCDLTRFHAKLHNPHFSSKMILAQLGVPLKCHLDVLIYEINVPTFTLHIYVVPRDICMIEAAKSDALEKGERIYKPRPVVCLWIGSEIRLTASCEAEISPPIPLNYITPPNFLELCIEDPPDSFDMEIVSQNTPLWEGRIRAMAGVANTLTTETITAIRLQLIKGMSEAVLNALMDNLLCSRVITTEDKSMISQQALHREEKVRRLVDTVWRKNGTAFHTMLSKLGRIDVHLYRKCK